MALRDGVRLPRSEQRTYCSDSPRRVVAAPTGVTREDQCATPACGCTRGRLGRITRAQPAQRRRTKARETSWGEGQGPLWFWATSSTHPCSTVENNERARTVRTGARSPRYRSVLAVAHVCFRDCLVTLQAVQTKGLVEQVFGQLVSGIMSGAYPVGSHLPSERALAETLQVNRQVVREASRRLAQVGLVNVLHGEGTRVLDFRAHGGLEVLALLMEQPGSRRSSIDYWLPIPSCSAHSRRGVRHCAKRAKQATARRSVASRSYEPTKEDAPSTRSTSATGTSCTTEPITSSTDLPTTASSAASPPSVDRSATPGSRPRSVAAATGSR